MSSKCCLYLSRCLNWNKEKGYQCELWGFLCFFFWDEYQPLLLRSQCVVVLSIQVWRVKGIKRKVVPHLISCLIQWLFPLNLSFFQIIFFISSEARIYMLSLLLFMSARMRSHFQSEIIPAIFTLISPLTLKLFPLQQQLKCKT